MELPNQSHFLASLFATEYAKYAIDTIYISCFPRQVHSSIYCKMFRPVPQLYQNFTVNKCVRFVLPYYVDRLVQLLASQSRGVWKHNS